MPRATNRVASRKRRKAIMGMAKGYWGRRKNVYTVAKNAVEKALQYQYRDRRARKRQFRRLWITRITAAVQSHGMRYSQFIHGVQKAGIKLNRKELSEMAIHDPATFGAICGQAKSAIS